MATKLSNGMCAIKNGRERAYHVLAHCVYTHNNEPSTQRPVYYIELKCWARRRRQQGDHDDAHEMDVWLFFFASKISQLGSAQIQYYEWNEMVSRAFVYAWNTSHNLKRNRWCVRRNFNSWISFISKLRQTR